MQKSFYAVVILFVSFFIASAYAANPVTTLINPNGSQILSDSYPIAFTTSDADSSDNLLASIYYSAITAGARQNTIVSDMNTNSYTAGTTSCFTTYLDNSVFDANTENWTQSGVAGGAVSIRDGNITFRMDNVGDQISKEFAGKNSKRKVIETRYAVSDLGKSYVLYYNVGDSNGVGGLPQDVNRIVLGIDSSDNAYYLFNEYADDGGTRVWDNDITAVAGVPRTFKIIMETNRLALYVDGALEYFGVVNVSIADFNYVYWQINSGTADANLYIDYFKLYENEADASVTKNCTYDFNFARKQGGQDYFVDVNVSDGTNTAQDSSNDKFSITGNINLKFLDENTLGTINPQVWFDSNRHDANTSGISYIPMQGKGIKQYTLDVNLTGYPTRRFLYDLNAYSNLDLNILLIDSNKGRDVNFQFDDINGTLQANRMITVLTGYENLGTAKYAGRKKTNGDGSITFFLDPDSNYHFDINATTPYTYVKSDINVLLPLDESDLNVLTPFDIIQKGIGYNEYIGNTTTTTISILPNTVDYYTLQIDHNYGNPHYSRTYSFRTRQGLLFQQLQPYLLKVVDSGVIQIFAKERTSLASLPNTFITIKKNIAGNLVIVEQQYTDAAGIAVFSLVFNETYYIDANYQGTGFANLELRPVFTQYDILIDLIGGINPPTLPVMTFDANYIPTTYTILSDNGFLNLGTTVYSNGAYISNVRVQIYQDANTFFDQNTSNGGVPFIQYIVDININDGGLTANHNIIFKTTITDLNANTKIFYHSITYLGSSSQDVFVKFEGLGSIFGETASAIIAIFATIFIVGLAIAGFGANNSISIIGGMSLLFFGIIGMFPLAIAIIACLFGFALYFLRSGL